MVSGTSLAPLPCGPCSGPLGVREPGPGSFLEGVGGFLCMSRHQMGRGREKFPLLQLRLSKHKCSPFHGESLDVKRKH